VKISILIELVQTGVIDLVLPSDRYPGSRALISKRLSGSLRSCRVDFELRQPVTERFPVPITSNFKQRLGIAGHILVPAPTVLLLLCSPVSESFGGHWKAERLDILLANPAGYAPGATMRFEAMQEPEPRAAKVAYIESLVQ